MSTSTYARSVCGECGESIYYLATMWLHVASDQARCYRDPHLETAYPDQGYAIEEPDGPAVLAFLVQCAICPQQALVDAQPVGDWTCPRCAEVTGGFGDIDVAQAEPTTTTDCTGCGCPIDRCNSYRPRRKCCPDCKHLHPWGDTIPWPPEADLDDHYPIEKVQG